jgi:hypothetical protein
MKKLFIVYLFFFSLKVLSCRQKVYETFDYATLTFDTTNTIIFKLDSTVYTFTKFSEPLALNNDDIRLADSLLNDAVDKFNKANSKRLYEAFNKQVPIDSFVIEMSKYKRQIFPYKDNNGRRILYLICFSKTFSKWRTKTYYGGLHGGVSFPKTSTF